MGTKWRIMSMKDSMKLKKPKTTQYVSLAETIGCLACRAQTTPYPAVPNHSPLNVILGLGRLECLHGEVGGEEKADEVGEETGKAEEQSICQQG